MIDRLNFFDFYGYLVPGLVFLLVLALPFILAQPGLVKDVDFGSGIVLLAVAYVTGLFLHGLAELVLPPKLQVDGVARQYSDVILYDDDPLDAFGSDELRRRLRKTISGYFRVDEAAAHTTFLACRTALLNGPRGSYVEQFQGLYALARGVAFSVLLGALYLAGWLAPAALGSLYDSLARGPAWMPWALPVAALAAAYVLLMLKSVPRTVMSIARREALETWSAWVLAAALFTALAVLGAALADGAAPAPAARLLLGAFFACALASVRFFAAWRHFALEFAKAVYHDFYYLLPEERRHR